MIETSKVKLTRERIRQIVPPARNEVTIWDSEVSGLGVRCLPSGVKSYIVIYRAGHGREGVARRMTLGKVDAIRLEDAREAALDIRGQVLRGQDPAAARKAAQRAARRPLLTLGQEIEKYHLDLQRRKVAEHKGVHSVLVRHLLGQLGDVPMATIDRQAVIGAIDALAAKEMPGAAQALRSHASTFLKWCADRGQIESNPLQGYRAARATRAQRVANPGRALSDNELVDLWVACSAQGINAAFGQLIRMLILTGQRRSETSRMRWADLDLAAAVWRIPASETKNGISHVVPLPALALASIAAAPRHDGCEYVFSTNGNVPISGWSNLEGKLREAAALKDHWTLHDLRRTYRSGLSRLGIDPDVSEIMLNHRPETLRAIYDRDPRMDARRDAAERWAGHVRAVTDPAGQSNIVSIKVAL